jgi:hypothetical protein
MQSRYPIAVIIACIVSFWFFLAALTPADQLLALTKCFILIPVLLLLPGYFIYKILFRDVRLPLALLPAVFFSLNLFLYFPLALFAYILKLNIVVYCWACLVLAVAAAAIYFSTSSREPVSRHTYFATRRDVYLLIFVLIIAAVVSLLSVAKGTFLFRGDLWLHISIIRKFFTRGMISPDSPLFFQGGFDSNYSYCLWHPVLAMLKYFGRLDISDLWFNAPHVIAFVAIITIYGFAQYLLKSHVAALLCLLVALYDMLFGNIFFQGILAIHYPYVISPLIVLPVVWVFIVEYMRGRGTKLAVLAIYGFAALLFLHKLTYFGFVLHLLFFAAVLVLISPRRKALFPKMLLLLIAVAAISIIYILLMPSVKVASPHHQTFLKGEINQLGDNYAIVKPEVAFGRAGIIIAHESFSVAPIISVILLPFIVWRLFRRKSYLERHPAPLYLLSGMLILPLVMLNPIAGGFIARRYSPEALVRLYQTLPHYLVVGYFAAFVFQLFLKKFCKREGRSKYIRRNNIMYAAVFVMLLIWMLIVYPGISKAMAEGEISYYNWKSTSPLYPVLKLIDSAEAQPQIILADYDSSYFITALTKHYVVMINPILSSPSMKDFSKRNSDLLNFLRSRNAEETASILKKYNTGYIVISNKKRFLYMEQYLDNVSLPGMSIKKIFSSPDVLAYKVTLN